MLESDLYQKGVEVTVTNTGSIELKKRKYNCPRLYNCTDIGHSRPLCPEDFTTCKIYIEGEKDVRK